PTCILFERYYFLTIRSLGATEEPPSTKLLSVLRLGVGETEIMILAGVVVVGIFQATNCLGFVHTPRNPSFGLQQQVAFRNNVWSGDRTWIGFKRGRAVAAMNAVGVEEEVDAVVIGAGIGGLTCAALLAKV
ncbi:unnamed protein product, partial [Choristocarpus tenellus]